MVENVLKDAYVPIILDADALNLAAEYRELTGYFTENIIVTPHMKEMSRLTGIQIEEMKENPVRTAREFADQYGVVCVFKGRGDGDRRKRRKDVRERKRDSGYGQRRFR